VSPRAQISLTAEEAAAFLAETRTLTCATIGRDGWPHLVALWFVVRGDDLWAWTYARSQKVRNLERDPRCTLQGEAGTRYDELRGLMLRCEAQIHRDTPVVEALGFEIMRRYAALDAGDAPPAGDAGARAAAAVAVAPAVEAMARRQAPKRVALQFLERGRVSWDHGKL
jgi:PPOX class probable F420-dependent enzyme